jgi:hypothetical protein
MLSEHEPNRDPSARERFFVCEHELTCPGSRGQVNCPEHEIPMDEDIPISEVKVHNYGDQRSTGNLIFKVPKVQIYEHHGAPHLR